MLKIIKVQKNNLDNNLPAFSQAMKIQKHCAHLGFDWNNIDDVMAKVEEEIDEVKAELIPQKNQVVDNNLVKEELGDLLFAVVNLCRHANADPEILLHQANSKFTKRFYQVEALVEQSGKAFGDHQLEQLEEYWEQVKAQE